MRNLPRATIRNENSFKLTSQALAVLMMVSAAFTLLAVIQSLVPNWQPYSLPVLCLFTSLVRLITYPRFKRMTQLSREWVIAVLSEWIVILILV